MSKLLRNGIPRTEDGKIDLSWKNHYGFTGFIVICGFLFPPLAVAVRFGIGKDFLINVLLTICGIIPGHMHNWFIQNIRNNDTKARTPRWAIRYGLVDDRSTKKLAKKRQWTARFNDRLPPSQRVVYDDNGVAHVVQDEVETREDRVTAPWNVNAAGGGGVKEHKTGLVEPDQWINSEPEMQSFDYAHIEQAQQRKPSKLARFRSSKHAESRAEGSHSRARSNSMASTTSSLSVSTPEEATRSTFDATGHKSRAYLTEQVGSTAGANNVSRRDDDIFSHEF